LLFDHFSAPKRQTIDEYPLLLDSPSCLFCGWMRCLLGQGWARLVRQLVLTSWDGLRETLVSQV